jgi:hypothetical protein
LAELAAVNDTERFCTWLVVATVFAKVWITPDSLFEPDARWVVIILRRLLCKLQRCRVREVVRWPFE